MHRSFLQPGQSRDGLEGNRLGNTPRGFLSQEAWDLLRLDLKGRIDLYNENTVIWDTTRIGMVDQPLHNGSLGLDLDRV